MQASGRLVALLSNRVGLRPLDQGFECNLPLVIVARQYRRVLSQSRRR